MRISFMGLAGIVAAAILCYTVFLELLGVFDSKPTAPPAPSVVTDDKVISSIDGPTARVFSLVDGSKWVIVGPEHNALVMWEAAGANTWQVISLSYNDGGKVIDFPKTFKPELDQLNSQK